MTDLYDDDRKLMAGVFRREPVALMQIGVIDALNALHSRHFKRETRLTFIARTPGEPDADIVITADDLDELAALIRRRAEETTAGSELAGRGAAATDLLMRRLWQRVSKAGRLDEWLSDDDWDDAEATNEGEQP